MPRRIASSHAAIGNWFNTRSAAAAISSPRFFLLPLIPIASKSKTTLRAGVSSPANSGVTNSQLSGVSALQVAAGHPAPVLGHEHEGIRPGHAGEKDLARADDQFADAVAGLHGHRVVVLLRRPQAR